MSMLIQEINREDLNKVVERVNNRHIINIRYRYDIVEMIERRRVIYSVWALRARRNGFAMEEAESAEGEAQSMGAIDEEVIGEVGSSSLQEEEEEDEDEDEDDAERGNELGDPSILR